MCKWIGISKSLICNQKLVFLKLLRNIKFYVTAPCFDPDTNEKIGYFTFYYIQQPKYIDKNTPDGYLNHFKMFYVFDQFQKPDTVKVYDFVADIEFESDTLNQRLPVGKYSTALNSSALKITSKSVVKADIRPDATRYWVLDIDWKDKN